MSFSRQCVDFFLIGEVPPQNMLDATRELIALAVQRGHLSSNYTLFGHRQVLDTTCPGAALYQEIQNWPHYDTK